MTAYRKMQRAREQTQHGAWKPRPVLPQRHVVEEGLAELLDAAHQPIEHFLPRARNNIPTVYEEAHAIEGLEEELEMLGYHSPDAFAHDILRYDPRALFARDTGYANGKLIIAKPDGRKKFIPSLDGTDSHEFQEDFVGNAGDTDRYR